tara:strand:- start:219 stop:1355 length:1137 start_codon:yes stop_codon:yes gene_type:complete
MSELKEEKDTKEPLKVKAKRPSNLGKRKEDEVFKVKLNDKTEEDAVQDKKTETISSVGETESVQSTEQTRSEERPIIKEVPKQEIEKEIENHIPEKDYPTEAKVKMPENIEKLVNFMKETGGNIEDYVRLNTDYTNVSSGALLEEYYATTKPHLDKEEIKFLLNDKFEWDEDIADEREKKQKQLALKEEVAKAKNFLEDTKIKYYDEIKLKSNVNPDQQKAMDFFNRYNKEQEIAKQRHEDFMLKTNSYLTEDFEGFDINVGDKRFKYGVSNPKSVAETQSNLNTLLGKFLDKEGNVNDHKAYHKAMYAARNVDTIAEHFYEQGKADAIKDITAKSNNTSSENRQTPAGAVSINGWTVKAISGVDSSKLKIKNNKNKN